MVLPKGAVLNRRYAIRRPLGDPSPFDIKYLGEDLESEERVVIQEYFPQRLAHRKKGEAVWKAENEKQATLFEAGMEYFRKEGRVLSGIDHPHLIKERVPFEANGTIYRVRAYYPGMSLEKGLEKGKTISERAALAIIVSVLKVLKVTHQQGLLHGGISPTSIHLMKDGRALLYDFQSAFIQLARRSDQLTEIVRPGTSPIEQYTVQGKQGPWTDVYACAATMYRATTGQMPPEATQRLEGDRLPAQLAATDVFTPAVREVIGRALAVEPAQRIQSVEAFMDRLQVAVQRPEKAVSTSAPEADASEIERTGKEENASPPDASPSDASPPDEPAEQAIEPESDAEAGSEETEPSAPAEGKEKSREEATADVEEDASIEGNPAELPVDEVRPDEQEVRGEQTAPLSSKVEATDTAEGEPESPDSLATASHEREAHARTETADWGEKASQEPEEPQETEGSESDAEPIGGETAGERQDRSKGESVTDEIEEVGAFGKASAPDEASAPEEAAEGEGKEAVTASSEAVLSEAVPSERSERDSFAESGEPSGREDRPSREIAHAEDSVAQDEDDPSEEGASSKAGMSRWKMVIGLPVLLTILSGAVLMMGDSLGFWKNRAEHDPYAAFRTYGDSLFERAEYAVAERFYTQALQLRPEDEHVAQRLRQIKRRKRARRRERYTQRMAEGDSLMTRADSLFQASNLEAARALYSQANNAYLAALDNRPGDTVAGQKLAAVDSLLTAATKRAASGASQQLDADQLFAFLRDQGDQQFVAGNYEVALRKYREALDYRPNSEYVLDQIKVVQSRIQAEQIQAQYDRYMQQGDSLFDRAYYTEAKAQYEQALELRPADSDARAQIEEIDSLLAARAEREQQYQYHRGRGDGYFDREDFEAAVESYQKALEYRPDDAYVTDRLAASREALVEQRRAEQKQREAAERRKAAERRRQRMQKNGVFVAADEKPILIGGLAGLHEKVQYPSSAVAAGVEGRVYLQVIVNKDGTVREVKVLKGIGSGCDEEALRVVRQARFEPAKVDGEPVPYQHTLWLQFRIEGDDEDAKSE